MPEGASNCAAAIRSRLKHRLMWRLARHGAAPDRQAASRIDDAAFFVAAHLSPGPILLLVAN